MPIACILLSLLAIGGGIFAWLKFAPALQTRRNLARLGPKAPVLTENGRLD